MRPLLSVAILLIPSIVAGQARSGADLFSARRESIFAAIGKGLLIVTSQDRPDDSGVRQTPDFYYLTGLGSMLGGALVLDGATREARLFYPGVLGGPAGWISRIPPGRVDTAGAGQAGFTALARWELLVPYLSGLLAADSTRVLYLDAADPSLMPSAGMALDTVPDDPQRRWREALARRWPRARIEDGAPLLQAQRAVKEDVCSSGYLRRNRDEKRPFCIPWQLYYTPVQSKIFLRGWIHLLYETP